MSLKLTPITTPVQLVAFSATSWDGDPADKVVEWLLNLNGLPVCWTVTKQTTVALSLMKSEYISSSKGTFPTYLNQPNSSLILIIVMCKYKDLVYYGSYKFH